MSNLNFPNSLTLVRISLIPILVISYYLPIDFRHELSTIIFIIAGFTDWLDGYFARKLKQETKFGEFCDPVADKLIVVIALMLLLESYNSYLITIPAIIIVSRELIISGLREWMAKQGNSSLVTVSHLGKVKTAVQMFSISVLLYWHEPITVMIKNLGLLSLFIAAGLTLWTMILYLCNAWPKLYAN